jgi:hypothetical protein
MTVEISYLKLIIGFLMAFGIGFFIGYKTKKVRK